MAVEYNNFLQRKDFKETFKFSDIDGWSATFSATKVKVTVT